MCFLTGVGGAFTGGQNTYIGISNGYWVLTGSGASARAACYNWSTLSANGNQIWQSGFYNAAGGGGFTSPVQMYNTDAFCSLQGVGGAFNGGGESMWTSFGSTNWSLLAQSQSPNTYGWGSCFAAQPGKIVSPISAWVPQGSANRLLAPAGSYVCALTSVSGRFRGGGEHVDITRTSGDWWQLSVTSQQVDVSATAKCVPLHW
jgi:hypothetical protein